MASKKDILYLKSFEEAKEAGEVELYNDSKQKNIDCADAIGEAITDSYRGTHTYDLKSAAESVIADFGEERVKFVTAWQFQKKDWDGRFSDENKSWANAANIQPAVNEQSCYINSHATLIDGFANHLRKITESPEVGNYKIKKSVLFTNNRGIAFGESKSAVSPFVTWQFKVDPKWRARLLLGTLFQQ